MDYNTMMMETPEETVKRFERKRKLKEVLCKFGLIAHKVHLGDATHFAFALATPTGTPIAQPCSSDDMSECAQWLSKMYPTHFFFQDKSCIYDSANSCAKYTSATDTATPLEKPIVSSAGPLLASSFPTTVGQVVGSYKYIGSSGVEVSTPIKEVGGPSQAHPGVADLPDQQQRRVDQMAGDGSKHHERLLPSGNLAPPWSTDIDHHEPEWLLPSGNLAPPWSTDLDHHKPGNMRPSSGTQNDSEPPEKSMARKSDRRNSGNIAEEQQQVQNIKSGQELGSGGGGMSKDQLRGGHGHGHGHGDQHRGQHRSTRKDRRTSKDGSRSRGGRTRGGDACVTPAQVSKSDEGSGIGGQDVPNSLDEIISDKILDSQGRPILTVAEKMKEGRQPGQLGAHGWRSSTKVFLESDAESKPKDHQPQFPNLSQTTLGGCYLMNRVDSSDLSQSLETSGLDALGTTRLPRIRTQLTHPHEVGNVFDRSHVYAGTNVHSRLRLHEHDRSMLGHSLEEERSRGQLSGSAGNDLNHTPPTYPSLHHNVGTPEGTRLMMSRDKNHSSRGPVDSLHMASEKAANRPGMGTKVEKTLAWKPSPLYQAPITPAPEKSESSFDSVCTDADNQAYDDEACEKEERAMIRYLRLFADDKSWKEGFSDAPEGLTCDVCKLQGKVKRVPDARALVSHAKTMKIVKMAEHRGYARAICELMNFDLVAPDHAKKLGDKSSKKQEDEYIVWPPVLVLENTRTEKGPDGLWKGIDEVELDELFEVALAHKRTHTFRPICGKHGHKGRVLVEFPPSRQAWLDATTLHRQFKVNARGYTEWLAVKPRWRNLTPGCIADSTDFVRLDDMGNPKRVLYGYLAETRHMEVFDPSRKYIKNWKSVRKDIL